MKIDLTNRFEENSMYEAWKFPGGELHFKLTKDGLNKIVNPYKPMEVITSIEIVTTLESSDDILLLCLAVDTIKNYHREIKINVFIKYMAYQQADRRFSNEECFSLKTVCNILNLLPVDSYMVFDPHSDVTTALLKNCGIVTNYYFVQRILHNNWKSSNNLFILSPDAGAYKKIFKLVDNIGFKGRVECANKFRDDKGNIDIRLSCNDFEGKDILIVDDICVGGRTFIQLAESLQDKNIGNLYLAVSHGVFSNGITELQRYFKQIFTTNSRHSDSHRFINVYNKNIF